MRHRTHLLTLAAAMAFAGTAPAAAQSGFGLKGGLVFNSSDVEENGSNVDLADAAGFHIGAEYVLPVGIGLGIAGYTAGSPGDFDTSEGSLVMLGEANYFFSLPILPISPYAGVHVGLGTLDMGELEDVQHRRPEVDFDDLGFQLGIRFQPSPLIGVDAQYRRVSGKLEGEQDTGFDTNQVLIGVTVF